MHRLLWIAALLAAVPAAAGTTLPHRLPDRAAKVLAELNEWCSHGDDCDVSQRPAAYPHRIAAGETNGWILTHREALARLGVRIQWRAAPRRFDVVTP